MSEVRFHLRSGEATFGPAKRALRAYAVRPEGGRMLVGIP